MSFAKIRPRRGTLTDWNTANPILDEGELAWEYPDSGVGSGICKVKIGDGIHRYKQLQYALDGTSASEIIGGGVDSFHLISIRSGTEAAWNEANPVIGQANGPNEIIYVTDKNAIKIGDGTTRFKQLPYINCQDTMRTVYDFGNEDNS